jgi:hypothetical protein
MAMIFPQSARQLTCAFESDAGPSSARREERDLSGD